MKKEFDCYHKTFGACYDNHDVPVEPHRLIKFIGEKGETACYRTVCPSCGLSAEVRVTEE